MDYDELVADLRHETAWMRGPQAADAIVALQARVAELERLLTHTVLLAAQEEHNALRHDIERHVAIAAEQATELERLRARIAELSERNEQLQVQLAGCGVAALQNTRKSIAEQRIGRDQYGFSGSYDEVCNAVDREIHWRERAERAEADLNERLDEIVRVSGQLAAARALLQKLHGSVRLYRGGGVAGQQMGNESYSILVTGHTLGDIDAALAGDKP